MKKKLTKLIDNFNKKLENAKDARAEIMDYLEEKYDIDTRKEYETIEESCEWCYGVDIDGIEKLIEKSKKQK